jgi:hypothetical protein
MSNSEWERCPTCSATKGDKASDHDLGCELTDLRTSFAEAVALLREVADGAGLLTTSYTEGSAMADRKARVAAFLARCGEEKR